MTCMIMKGVSSGDDLVSSATDNKIDKINVGVRNRSKVGKLLLGSVTQLVILEAQCPVVSVKWILFDD